MLDLTGPPEDDLKKAPELPKTADFRAFFQKIGNLRQYDSF